MFKFALLNALLILGLNASDDLLLKATNGVVSQNSAGVKILNDSEMKKVTGGYAFSGFRLNSLVFTPTRPSRTYNDYKGSSLINRPCAYFRWGC